MSSFSIQVLFSCQVWFVSFYIDVVEHRITEQLSLEGLSCPTWLLKQGKESCQGPCPGSSWIPQKMESPQHLCALCASSLSPSHWKSIPWCSNGSSRVSVNAHSFVSHHWDHWAPLNIWDFVLVPRMETSQPPWASYSGAQSAQSKNKSVDSPVFQSNPISSFPVIGHHQEDPGFISLHPAFRYLHTLKRSSWVFPYCKLNSPVFLSLS